MKQFKRVQRGFRVDPDRANTLANIRVVLVGTTHPGNIGAVARVMKNMGLSNLTLVSSTDFGPDTDAFTMSSGAYDIVERAVHLRDLKEAIHDCVMSVGTSARLGGKRTSTGTPAELAPQLVNSASSGPVAVVFGRESCGLTNEELSVCTHHMVIPTDGEFASMNISHACAVIAYEIFKMVCAPMGVAKSPFLPASVETREEMYRHMETVLIKAGFLRESDPLLMMRDLRRIFNSALMDDRDVRILRGIFRKIGNMVRIAEEKLEQYIKNSQHTLYGD
ncbi:MAG: RNA methyltransferase [Pseudomonadota bacterium]